MSIFTRVADFVGRIGYGDDYIPIEEMRPKKNEEEKTIEMEQRECVISDEIPIILLFVKRKRGQK